MTNLFSPSKKKKLLTPENSLLFTPIILGILVLISLLIFIFKPLMTKLDNEEKKIKVLEDKILYIPIYKKYINDLSLITIKAQNQQKRLIELISDPNELNTILSEINRICVKYSIDILNIEPKPIVKYKKTETTNNSSGTDPFLSPLVEKHIFQISIKGNYNALINFLKDLELLQSIVISDNIEIKVSPNNSLNVSVNKPLMLNMKFDLSTYAQVDNKKIDSSIE